MDTNIYIFYHKYIFLNNIHINILNILYQRKFTSANANIRANQRKYTLVSNSGLLGGTSNIPFWLPSKEGAYWTKKGDNKDTGNFFFPYLVHNTFTTEYARKTNPLNYVNRETFWHKCCNLIITNMMGF